MKLSVNEAKWSSFASQDPDSYSLNVDLNIWFWARKVTGTFEKWAPGRVKIKVFLRNSYGCINSLSHFWLKIMLTLEYLLNYMNACQFYWDDIIDNVLNI